MIGFDSLLGFFSVVEERNPSSGNRAYNRLFHRKFIPHEIISQGTVHVLFYPTGRHPIRGFYKRMLYYNERYTGSEFSGYSKLC